MAELLQFDRKRDEATPLENGVDIGLHVGNPDLLSFEEAKSRQATNKALGSVSYSEIAQMSPDQQEALRVKAASIRMVYMREEALLG